MAKLRGAKELADESPEIGGSRELLSDYINGVMAPAECLERIFIDCYDYSHNAPQCGLDDVGVVMKALTSLARFQLGNLVTVLEGSFGGLEVIKSGVSPADPLMGIVSKTGLILTENQRRET